MSSTTRTRLVVGSVVALALVAAGLGLAGGTAAPKQDGSPHTDALSLLFRTQADAIRKVEAPERIDGTPDESWWHDTKERTWVVKRPFSPGTIDSTHLFHVAYRIDGKDAAAWTVDTRKGTATRVEAKE